MRYFHIKVSHKGLTVKEIEFIRTEIKKVEELIKGKLYAKHNN